MICPKATLEQGFSPEFEVHRGPSAQHVFKVGWGTQEIH